MNLTADQERRALELFEREMLCAFRNLDNPQDLSGFGATAQTPAEAEAAAGRLALEYARELVWLRDEVERLRSGVLKVIEAQEFYPDTHTGMRQQWIKDEIARKVRALLELPS